MLTLVAVLGNGLADGLEVGNDAVGGYRVEVDRPLLLEAGLDVSHGLAAEGARCLKVVDQGGELERVRLWKAGVS